MTRRKLSRLEGLRVSLQAVTARDVVSISVVVVFLVVVLVATFGSGLNVGAHIWRPGWLCGETLKGAPWCHPDPRGDPAG